MPRKRDKYIDIALDIANKSSMSKQHGAVIVLRGKILSTGYNKYLTRAISGKTWRDELQIQLRKEWMERDIQTSFSTFSNGGWGKMSCSLHAEMDAMIKAGISCNNNGSVLYVTRRSAIDGRALNSNPCKRCTKAAFRRGIKIIYT
uniref:CMP/dCMP-type deaminase domain-containing protein n=1 Tax=viral metagenome TaxID=1070528 RepID=A0A6C0FF09_9ZZZZ|tara:strand:+ start:5942 stop:6379 length:438 start_codon:yes stop_codon:yes gene_type:complete